MKTVTIEIPDEHAEVLAKAATANGPANLMRFASGFGWQDMKLYEAAQRHILGEVVSALEEIEYENHQAGQADANAT